MMISIEKRHDRVEEYKRIELTASQFIRQVAAIVREIAESYTIDAFLIRTGVLRDRIARTSVLDTHRHVVLVGTISTVVDSIA